jgi:tRNA A37 methylthiotransferase MiaB
MMTPNTVSDVLEDLMRVFKSEKIFKFVHLPVQSGDNQVLKLMRRFYSAKAFKNIVSELRTSFSEITIATDIICGFPGESKEAFDRTLRLIEEVKPDVVNVSKYFSRPGTLAAEMHENLVLLSEIRRRSSLAAALARKVSISRNQRWIGWTGEILVDEVGKISGSWIGRNFAYRPIAVKSSDDLFGKKLRVRIVRAFPTYLQGTVV